VLGAFGAMTFQQSRTYRSEDTLWADTLARNPACFMCETNYGHWLLNNGRESDAVAHFEESLRLKADNVPALLNLGRVAEQGGRLDEAAARLRTALQLDPNNTLVLINLATVNTKAGRLDEAVAEYREALRLGSPDDYLAHNGLGAALMGQRKVPEAVEHFREVLRLKPDYSHGRDNLDRALAIQNAPR
jgi:Tfp pilus assembly protein PilF